MRVFIGFQFDNWVLIVFNEFTNCFNGFHKIQSGFQGLCFNWLNGVSTDFKKFPCLQRVSKGFNGIQNVSKTFKKLSRGVTRFHCVKMVFNGFKGLRCVSSAFKVFKRVSNGCKGLGMFSKELWVGFGFTWFQVISRRSIWFRWV